DDLSAGRLSRGVIDLADLRRWVADADGVAGPGSGQSGTPGAAQIVVQRFAQKLHGVAVVTDRGPRKTQAITDAVHENPESIDQFEDLPIIREASAPRPKRAQAELLLHDRWVPLQDQIAFPWSAGDTRDRVCRAQRYIQ